MKDSIAVHITTRDWCPRGLVEGGRSGDGSSGMVGGGQWEN